MKQIEIGEAGTHQEHIPVCGEPEHCTDQGHFRIIWCILPKMACNLKIAGCRVKHIEIMDSGTPVTHTQGTIDCLVVKVCSGHSVYLSQNNL